MKRLHHCVIVFQSSHDVSAAERTLSNHGLWCDRVPTPRALSSNCGTALEFHGRDLEQVTGIVDSDAVRCVGVFSSGGGINYAQEF